MEGGKMMAVPPLPFFLKRLTNSPYATEWYVRQRDGNAEPATEREILMWEELPEETRKACRFDWREDMPVGGLLAEGE